MAKYAHFEIHEHGKKNTCFDNSPTRKLIKGTKGKLLRKKNLDSMMPIDQRMS